MHGANHERNLRPGTENVSSIVGLGKACDLIHKNLGKYIQNYKMMRDLLEEELLREDFDLRINGDKENRLPNTSSISFRGKSANEILGGIQGIAVSAGAACHADDVTISHVLCAMGVPEDDAIGTIRFSTGKFTTRDEIISAVELIKTLF
jgi:cysteine desulfurase